LPQLREARAQGLPLTAETCPHYLHFTAEAIPDGATPFKCAPPIRDAANREELWRALAEGVLSMVASDHSPCSPALKALEVGDFVRAWGGVAGLQLALPVIWTEASSRGFSIHDIVRWMCVAPAALAGLTGRKGALAAGADADFIIFDDAATFSVKPEAIEHRHKVTPYAGESLRGGVLATYVRGVQVAEAGRVTASELGVLL
jgi:allantoinase